MTKERAIEILERRTTIPDGEYTWEQINQAIDMAISALRPVSREQELEAENKELKERIVNWRKYMAPTREQVELAQPCKPLTLEQLREMDGQPVWIVEYPDWGHWELSEDANDYIVDRNLDFYGMKHDDPDGRYGLHKLGWLAYSYPPAHIDRGEWTAEWIYPENEWNLPRCSKCGCNSKDATYGHKDRFCPKCGRAMTEEAWAKLERRLQRTLPPEPPEEG